MSFVAAMGRYPLLRYLGGAVKTALDNAFEPVDLEAHQPLPEHLRDGVVIIDTARVLMTCHHTDLGAKWTTVTALRHGSVMGAKPMRRLAFGPIGGRPSYDLVPDATFDVEDAGRVWVVPASKIAQLEKIQHIPNACPAPKRRPQPLAFIPKDAKEFLRVLAVLEWIDRSADAELLTPIQRLALARTATLEVFNAGRCLTERGKIGHAVRQLGPAIGVHVQGDRRETSVLTTGSFLDFASWLHKPATSTARVERSGWVLSWSRDLVSRITQQSPLEQGAWMTRFCQDRREVYGQVTALTAALLDTPILTDIDRARAETLLQGSTVVQWRVGAPPPVPVGLEPGLSLITEGEVVGSRILPGEISGSIARIRFEPIVVRRGRLECDDEARPTPPQILGVVETAHWLDQVLNKRKPAREGSPFDPSHFSARVPSRAVFIPAWRIAHAFGAEIRDTVRRFHESMEQQHVARHRLTSLDDTSDLFTDDFTVVWLSDGHGRPPRNDGPNRSDIALIQDLAGRLAAANDAGGFEEKSLLVEIVDGGASATGKAEVVEQTASWTRVRLSTSTGRALNDVYALLRRHRDRTYAFLWSGPDVDFQMQIASGADIWMLMNRDPCIPWPSVHAEHTAYLYANLARAADNAHLPPAALRLHTLLDDATPELGFAGRSETMGRWARAVGRRRIGLALGGGGAWGWAHISLLYAMMLRNIPVDMISGASFGSVAGAFYALGGLPGLRYAIENDRELQSAVFKSMVFGDPIAKYFDTLPAKLGAWIETVPELDLLPGIDDAGSAHRRMTTESTDFDSVLYRQNLALLGPSPVQLQHTPIPFFPVATDLVAGSEAPILHRTVGRGVRASGSLPPLFPVTRGQDAIYADGGLSRNVPADVVQLEGAALIVGSNIVPPPFIKEPPVPTSNLGMAVARLSPIRRMLSTLLGVQTLFNQAGAVDTGLAPVLFQSEWDGKLFFQIDQARNIVTDTMAARSFWQALDGLDDMWHDLRRPRQLKKK